MRRIVQVWIVFSYVIFHLENKRQGIESGGEERERKKENDYLIWNTLHTYIWVEVSSAQVILRNLMELIIIQKTTKLRDIQEGNCQKLEDFQNK